MNRLLNILVCCVLASAFVACKPGTPKQFIQPDDMEDLLVDYHRAQALAEHLSFRVKDSVPQQLYLEAVLRKHGVTREHFDSSLVYYYKRSDRFDDIYKRVADRLEEEALVLGASESDIGKYALLNASGDTANIWNERPMMLMLPRLPYNRWEFCIDTDSLLRAGDRFLLQFISDFTYQDGSKNGVAYVAVDYEDTIVTRNMHFTTSGFHQLNVETTVKQPIRQVRGFFYVDGANEVSSTLRLLFLREVQLIRFHTQKPEDEPEEMPEDSLQLDTSGRQLDADALSGRDSTERGGGVLPVDTGAAPHGVAARMRHLEP